MNDYFYSLAMILENNREVLRKGPSYWWAYNFHGEIENLATEENQ